MLKFLNKYSLIYIKNKKEGNLKLDLFEIYKSKICSTGIKIIYDSVEYTYLRTIPLLNYFSFNIFTYPYSWRGGYNNDFSDYQYILDKFLMSDNLPENLVCITNQYYEENEQQYSINKTIRKYLKNKNHNLIIVIDKKNLSIKGKFRPLDEEYFIHFIYSYDELYQNLRQKYNQEGFSFSFQNSKNLFFQELSILIELISNDKIVNFKDLFENLIYYPYLPIWHFFSQLFGRKGTSIPSSRREIAQLANFFQIRFEMKKSKIEKILKKFLEELSLTNIHLLDPVNIRKIIKNGFSQELEKFKNRINNIQDKTMKRRFYYITNTF